MSVHCRYDVLLQANQPPGNYWINALAQNATRTGSPGGYGVLRYTGVNATLPTDSILQPESAPAWSPSTVSAVGFVPFCGSKNNAMACDPATALGLQHFFWYLVSS